MPSTGFAVSNTFATQPGPIPLSQLDANFSAAAVALNSLSNYSNYFVDSSGAANSITVTVTSPLAFAYVEGIGIQVKLANTNTSSTVGINVNGLGSRPVLTEDGQLPPVGSLTSGSIFYLMYNGSSFVVMGLFSPIVYGNIPQNVQNTNYTLVAADAGKHIYSPTGGPYTWTIPANASVPYRLGTTLMFVNQTAGNITIAINSDVLALSPGGATGSRTLAAAGVATALKTLPTQWIIYGNGLT